MVTSYAFQSRAAPMLVWVVSLCFRALVNERVLHDTGARYSVDREESKRTSLFSMRCPSIYFYLQRTGIQTFFSRNLGAKASRPPAWLFLHAGAPFSSTWSPAYSSFVLPCAFLLKEALSLQWLLNSWTITLFYSRSAPFQSGWNENVVIVNSHEVLFTSFKWHYVTWSWDQHRKHTKLTSHSSSSLVTRLARFFIFFHEDIRESLH